MIKITCYLLTVGLLPIWVVNTALASTLDLERRISVTWQEIPLGVALERIAETQQIPVWLDRRVDPGINVNLNLQQTALSDVLKAITEHGNLGFCKFENILYVGPGNSAKELPLLAQNAKDLLEKAHPSIRRRWLKKKARDWPELSEPRQLLLEIAKSMNFTANELDRIPYDLWHKRKLPQINAVDASVLLLIGFDLTCEIASDGKSFQVIPIERPIKQSRKSFNRPSPPKKRPASSSRQVYSLKIQNKPVGPTIAQLAKQLNLTLVWDPELIESKPTIRDVLISCDLKQVDQAKLVEGILKPAGLTGKVRGKLLSIKQSQ